MKILIVSDKESKALWDFYEPGKLDDYDLILSCGDLAPQYLSFLATFTKAPVLYVHGNHDDCYDMTPPDGCECIDDKMYNFKGLRILGFGGCMRYKPGTYQYTEEEMSRRVKSARFKIRRAGGVDLIVTHAPAEGVGDSEDLTHKGFSAFRTLMDQYHPKYFVHGHVHANYGRNIKSESTYGDTCVINAYERYVLTIPDEELQPDESRSKKRAAIRAARKTSKQANTEPVQVTVEPQNN